MSLSSAANRLVDEAPRREEHPGIVFRPGPTGRRAGLIGGPDVWEAVPARSLRIAIRYWASYPDEVDAEMAAADAADQAAEEAWRRERRLLAG